MATKLRRFSTSSLTKFFAFILIVLLITSAVLQVINLSYQNLNPEAMFVEHYRDSMDYHYEVLSDLRQIELIPEYGPPGDKVRYYYFLDDGAEEYSNAPVAERSYFAQHEQAFFAFEEGQLSMADKTRESGISNRLANYKANEGYIMYLAYPDDYLAEREQHWQENRELLLSLVTGIAICLVLAVLLIIYLIRVTGRKPDDGELHLSTIDNTYSDFLLAILIFLGVFWVGGSSEIMVLGTNYNLADQLDIYQIYSLIGMGSFTAAICSLFGVVLLSLVRKIKAHRLIRHSFIFSICYRIYDLIRSMVDGRRFTNNSLTKILFLRQRNFIIASAVLVFFTMLFLMAPPLIFVTITLEMVLIYWYIKSNNETFAEINKGFNESLEEQMRAERHKIALVTNVSHDLKTPLTSIISYVDLLAKEEELSETARDYVTILEEKSERLKNIVADLFDLAKSTSGDIALEMESLDLKKLIEQTLGDMEDRIAEAGLPIRTNLPENPIYIYSDGKKLYRVFQNIIDNALKYSLQGTRIYIELAESEGKAIVAVKNTAGYEMDFTAEEILQRFSRGDKSRATEGSGLGLSIAESFTYVCGGEFKVNVDGDLFKVTISFNIK